MKTNKPYYNKRPKGKKKMKPEVEKMTKLGKWLRDTNYEIPVTVEFKDPKAKQGSSSGCRMCPIQTRCANSHEPTCIQVFVRWAMEEVEDDDQ